MTEAAVIRGVGTAYTAPQTIAVARRDEGIVVHSLSDVLPLSPEQIKPAPQFNSQLDASFITGIGTARAGDQERMLILADIERLMRGADMGLVETAVQMH